MPRRTLITRRRFQLCGALLFGALLPFVVRSVMTPGSSDDATTLNTLNVNIAAVIIAMWVRMSVETYPGVRASSLNLPIAAASHGAVIALIVLLRLPYDRLGVLAGFLVHLLWLYVTYFLAQRGARLVIGIVPFGETHRLTAIEQVDWRQLRHPRLDHISGCQAIVADFGADLPPVWEAFLADAAVDGRIVYQVKQLSESLTGRVEIDHISENSFGSLMPARGYFRFKEMADFLFTVLMLPLFMPLMLLIALAIAAEGDGPVFFRQRRVGHAGGTIELIKFRTMRPLLLSSDARSEAMTGDDDARITRIGQFLRRTRLDELPQLWNVLKGQMSWIGPRPEAQVLSAWYTTEIPFYRYRHVVKPGISGWAQVNQGHVANVADVHRKLQYDFYYIKYFSPWLDVLIVFRTIKTMVNGFGSR